MAISKNKFLLLILVRIISIFGTFLDMIVVNIYLIELTGSAYWVGAAMAIRTLVGVILSPLLGFLGDRFDRKSLMIISDFSLALAVGLLVFMPKDIHLPYIMGLMVISGIGRNLFSICLKSTLPNVLNESQILRANSILQGGGNMAAAIASLLAVFAHTLFNQYTTIFLIDAATYLLSGVVILTLPLTSKTKDSAKSQMATTRGRKKNKQSRIKIFIEEYGSVLKLKQSKVIFFCLLLFFIDAFGSSSHNIGWPIFSQHFDPTRPMFLYGIILFFWAIGNLLGIVGLNTLSFLKQWKPERLYYFFTIIMSAGIVLTFQANSFPFLVCAAIFAGIGDGTYQTYFMTYLQQVDDKNRSKIFALCEMTLHGGFGLGVMIVPICIGYFGAPQTALIFHAPAIVLASSALIIWNIFDKRGSHEA